MAPPPGDLGFQPNPEYRPPQEAPPTAAPRPNTNCDQNMKVPCEVCGELYDRKVLGRHRRRHKITEYKCHFCCKTFVMMTKLSLHLKEAHGTELTCSPCDKQFHNPNSFTAHMRNHKKPKTFICDICGFTTMMRRNLENHRISQHQMGQYPMHCTVCNKGFLNNNALNDHMNGHTGATPHQCHKCGSAYASVRTLERHSYKCNPDAHKDCLFRCGLCTRYFKTKKFLECHVLTKHPDGRRNVCDFCGKDFSFVESLVRHRRIHTGEKPEECVVCKKRFGCSTYLRSHMRTHTGEKPYQCRFCWKKFTQRSSVVTHEKSHLKNLASSGIEVAPTGVGEPTWSMPP